MVWEPLKSVHNFMKASLPWVYWILAKKKKTFTDSVVMGEVKGDKIKTSMTCGIKNVPMSDTLICWAEILAEDVFEMHDLFDFFDGRCFKT